MSGTVGLGEWQPWAERIAQDIRRLGAARVVFGSDGTADLLRPKDAWQVFRRIPLNDDEFATIAASVAPYLR